MDTKQTAILRDLHAKISDGDFGEAEVIALLNLLREDSPPDGVLRELGNFTHRRRDKGPVQQYMRRLKEFSDNYGKRNDSFRPDVVFTENQIAEALNAELARHGLAPLSQERDRKQVPTFQARSRQVQLAMLATLQHVALLNGKSEFGRLELCVAPRAFQLMGFVSVQARKGQVWVVTPALEVGNDFCPVPPPDPFMRPPAHGVWRVTVKDGMTNLDGLW